MIHHSLPPMYFRRFEALDINENKEEARKEIDKQIREFLARGNKIETVELRRSNLRPKNISELSAGATHELNEYIKSLPGVVVQYCKLEEKYMAYVGVDLVGKYDGRHKANLMAKKSYKAKLKQAEKNER